MDWYNYYIRRIETRPDQGMAIVACRDMTLALSEKCPLSWRLESGAAFLSALHDARLNPGVNVLPIYNEVEEALFSEVQAARLNLQADLELGIRNTGCGRPKQPRCKRFN